MRQKTYFGNFSKEEVVIMVNEVITELNKGAVDLVDNCTFKNGNDNELSEYSKKIINNSFSEQDIVRADRLKALMNQ